MNSSYTTTNPGTTIRAGNANSGVNAQLYFPHIGGIHEYFLECIQTALRPQELGRVCGDFASPTGSGLINFGSAINVSNSLRRDVFPWVTLGTNDIAHIVFVRWNSADTGPESLMYSNNASSGFSVATPIDNGAVEDPVITIKDNTLYVVYVKDNQIYLMIGTISGSSVSWSTAQKVSDNPAKSQVPHASVDVAGNLHIVWADQRCGDYNIQYRVRRPDGSFSTTQAIRQECGTFQADPEIAVTRDDKVHVVFSRGGTLETYYARLDGNTWSSQNISNTGDHSRSPSITTDGLNIYAAWEEGQPSPADNHDIVFTSSIDGGTTWSALTNVSNNSGLSNHVSISYAAATNTVYMVWSDDTGLIDDLEIWSLEYNITSGSFSLPTRITYLDNKQPSGLPVIDTGTSKLGVVWQDRATGQYEVYFLGGTIGTSLAPSGAPTPPPGGQCTLSDGDIKQRINNAWGLPPPQPGTLNGARGYTQLRGQLGETKANWSARSMLGAEEYVMTHGYPGTQEYLTTAWLWFENGSNGYPNLYSINCNDNRAGFISATSAFCNHTNFQIAGYQASKNYQQVWNQLYPGSSDSTFRSTLSTVAQNSILYAGRTAWMYQGNLDLLQYLNDVRATGQVNQMATSGNQLTCYPNSPTCNPNGATERRRQLLTLLAGKDPNMVAAMNSGAVAGSLVNGLKAGGCVYGYICDTERQILSNMVYALWQLDCGQ
jgi:hypothetical protein